LQNYFHDIVWNFLESLTNLYDTDESILGFDLLIEYLLLW